MRHAHSDGVAFVRCPRAGGTAALASVLAAELGVASSGEVAPRSRADPAEIARAEHPSVAGGGGGGELSATAEGPVEGLVERLVEALQASSGLGLGLGPVLTLTLTPTPTLTLTLTLTPTLTLARTRRRCSCSTASRLSSSSRASAR